MQFEPRHLTIKLPVNLRFSLVAFSFEGSNFTFQKGFVGNSSVQALPLENTNFNLGHVQPTPVFRGVMKLEFVQNPTGFSRWEGFVKRRGAMSIQVVINQNNLLASGIAFIGQPFQSISIVLTGALVCHYHVAVTCFWFDHYKQISTTAPLVF